LSPSALTVAPEGLEVTVMMRPCLAESAGSETNGLLLQAGSRVSEMTSGTSIPEKTLIDPSFRRMPESIALHPLDPGVRRDDEKRIKQKFPKRI
jgi:hypothetical protein